MHLSPDLAHSQATIDQGIDMDSDDKNVTAALLTVAATIGQASEELVIERYLRFAQRVTGHDPDTGPMKAFWERAERTHDK
ncbi:Hypothetical protein GbCGDNIH9_1129 [Granulibacter bethesdensis]|uniref:Uncharacterized protein n=1 Tax=Granulibacter bethesdensis TaxID=364410 RepID=A0AAC9P8V0_9PROT|nr:Hypothetical protein GbCGDNIH9_1129 [Granulibacter bethesdensis]APH61994.1 Hypothetical protein GbCGDNIH8_1129 [Granulibacter bethesdensis]